jgi:RNA polymerase sigma-70 factor, ECF subfamily
LHVKKQVTEKERMPEASEVQILRLLGNPTSREKGFTLLMDAYKEKIYWHIRRLVVSHEDAEDILQETFINVFRYAGSFNGDSKIYTWLYRIATNESLRLIRRRKKGLPGEILQDRGKKEEGYIQIEGDDILLKFQQAILQLPEKQKIVFNLRYYDELSYEEISQILNSSVNALKTNYHYASEKIKEYMINT